MQQHTKLSGQYRAVITRAGEVVKDSGWFDNLILNQGLDRIGQDDTLAVITHCHIGTGTVAPANTDTGLGTFVTATTIPGSTSRTNSGTPLYKTEITYTGTFAQGAVVGNMTEVGIGWAVSGANLFSRSLIVDGGGTPTALTVTSIDQLTIYYKLTFIPVLTDSTGSVVLAGITYNYTARVAQVANSFASGSTFTYPGYGLIGTYGNSTTCSFSNSTGVLGPVTGVPTNIVTDVPYKISTNAAYSAGNYYRDCAIALTTTEANVSGGIGAMSVTFGKGAFNHFAQYQFTPPIPKDNTKTLSLTFRISWSR